MLIRKDEFSTWIETTRVDAKLNYIDTVLKGCEEFKIETDLIKSLLSDQIIAKIKSEAIEMHFLKSTSTSLKGFL